MSVAPGRFFAMETDALVVEQTPLTEAKATPLAVPIALVPLFATTLFVSAFLLFLIQPMIAKMVLPILGGAPMVWNACIVFFQVTLLAGYAYAHAATSRLPARAQLALHVALVLVPLASLPVVIQRETLSPPDGNPIGWLLVLLAGSVGLPFFVLSTSASVLQHWFSRTDHPFARDPYFLYAASNVGSFAALFAYPALVEPLLSVRDQSRLWTVGYTLFVVLAIVCASAVWRFGAAPAPRVEGAVGDGYGYVPDLARRRARWVALAFVPSSLMLAVTSYLSTDIAAVPLLWIVPLGLYLVTFVVAFSRFGERARGIAARAFPLLVIPLALVVSGRATSMLSLIFPLHLVTFVAASTFCHGELAADRPDRAHLTEFYLWMSFGGMLGGLFNSLVAPLIFSAILEYPIVLVAACLLLPRGGRPLRVLLALAVAAAVGGLTMIFVLALGQPGNLRVLLAALAVPAVIAFSQRRTPLRFGLSLGAMMMVALGVGSTGDTLLHAERTFFGVYRVSADPDGHYRELWHGTTLHGLWAVDGPLSGQPLTYFHPTGPFGQAFRALPSASSGRQVAVIGLGVGSLAAYAGPEQRWTFYEIDPAVERIARNGSYFGFLERCGTRCRVAIGDARLSLARETSRYDLLVLDAFSSDAIPMHLLTSEALSLYLSRLEPGGAIVFHISNRHLSLEPIVARLAEAHGLVAVGNFDRWSPDWPVGRTESHWIVMARSRADLGGLASDARWTPLRSSAGTPLWTDDFSNILSVLNAH